MPLGGILGFASKDKRINFLCPELVYRVYTILGEAEAEAANGCEFDKPWRRKRSQGLWVHKGWLPFGPQPNPKQPFEAVEAIGNHE